MLWEPNDGRAVAVLALLDPDEQGIACVWALSGSSWGEAAERAGAPDPCARGERVMRKLKRLGRRYSARRAAAAVAPTGSSPAAAR